MDRCTEFQSQMLDYVYDLLDEGVAVVLGAHLDECAVCQSALREAQAQQQLFASAARLEFPAVRFVAPEDRRVQPGVAPERRGEPVDAPAVLSLPRAPARPWWRRWAAVAAVLVALVVPGWLTTDYVAARRTLDRHAAVAADRRHDLDALGGELAALDSSRQDALDRRERQVREQELRLVVSGSKNATAGAPNVYWIDARDDLNQATSALIRSVSVLDDQDKVVYQEKDIKARGTYQVTLPRDLPLEPGRGYKLQVVAAGGDQARTAVSQEFQITPPVYLAHLATDKPLYQPGETVRFRSVALERFS